MNKQTPLFGRRKRPTLAFALLLPAAAFPANAAVVMSSGSSNPVVGVDGISQYNSGGTLNGQADYTDNAGGASQSFSIVGAGSYTLNSISVKITSDFGGGVFTAGTFNLQVFRFDNANSGGYGERTDPIAGQTFSSTYLDNPFHVKTYTGIANLGVDPNGGDWITFTFSSSDLLTLAGGATYGFSIASTSGWAGIDVAQSDTYAGGMRWGAWGTPRLFDDNYVNPSKASPVDHAFAVNLTAVPEPSGFACLLGGSLLLFRRRSNRR